MQQQSLAAAFSIWQNSHAVSSNGRWCFVAQLISLRTGKLTSMVFRELQNRRSCFKYSKTLSESVLPF